MTIHIFNLFLFNNEYIEVIFLLKITLRYNGTFSGLNFCAKYVVIQLGFPGYVKKKWNFHKIRFVILKLLKKLFTV